MTVIKMLNEDLILIVDFNNQTVIIALNMTVIKMFNFHKPKDKY